MKTASTKPKILVVEDEPSIGDVCRRILSNEGFEVDVADNGKVAQGMIMQKQYELGLIDIRTPTMDGKELYAWLQESVPQLADRVIFTTGDLLAGNISSFLEATGRPFLAKPFSPVALKAIVKDTLRK